MSYHNPEVPGSTFTTEEEAKNANKKPVTKPIVKDK